MVLDFLLRTVPKSVNSRLIPFVQESDRKWRNPGKSPMVREGIDGEIPVPRWRKEVKTRD